MIYHSMAYHCHLDARDCPDCLLVSKRLIGCLCEARKKAILFFNQNEHFSIFPVSQVENAIPFSDLLRQQCELCLTYVCVKIMRRLHILEVNSLSKCE